MGWAGGHQGTAACPAVQAGLVSLIITDSREGERELIWNSIL